MCTTIACGARLNQVMAWNVTRTRLMTFRASTSGCALHASSSRNATSPVLMARTIISRYTTDQATKTLLISRRMKAKYERRVSHQYVDTRRRSQRGW